MKKTIFILFAGLLIAAVLSGLGYYLGFNDGTAKVTNAEKPIDVDPILISRVTYPLIDIFFDDESDWLVIDRNHLFTENESFNVIQNSKELQFNKEWLRVLTFPVGRGTTPNGIIYVYKDSKLIREVPYIEVHFGSEELRNAFRQLARNSIERLINDYLPSPI